MILTTIPELLEIVGIEYSWIDGQAVSDCPLCDNGHEEAFRFSDHLGRCLKCKWIGDQTDLAKRLKMYQPSSHRSLPNMNTLSWSIPNEDSRITLLNNELKFAKEEIINLIEELRDAHSNGELSDALFIAEEKNRWTSYLKYFESVDRMRDTIMLKEVSNACK